MQYINNLSNRRAFTLIELLVVVLIIGILSAIALPQYQKTIWKTRTTQLQTAVSSLAKAQEVYYLSNGYYSYSFSKLDVDFDYLSHQYDSTYLGVPSTDAIRANEHMELVINTNKQDWFFSAAIFPSGPYVGSGIVFVHQDAQLKEKTYYCVENSLTKIYSFCPKIMQTSSIYKSLYGCRYFAL